MVMGLDLALGLLVLFAAVRGWIQGFVNQAIWIGSLVSSVYLAEPVRDLVKPSLLPHMGTIEPDLVDRILWWASGLCLYFLLMGVGSTLVRLTRRPPIPGAPPGSRNNQFAGFLIGGLKGFVVACFLVAGLEKYGLDRLKTMDWAREQIEHSWALKWSREYQPAPRIWNSPPVQHLVSRIHQMGIKSPTDADSGGGGSAHADPAMRTASRAPLNDPAAPETRAASPGDKVEVESIPAPAVQPGVPVPPAAQEP
jgi:hypothetical protein